MSTTQITSYNDFVTAERKQLVTETLTAVARRTMLKGLCSIYHGENSDIYMAHHPLRFKRRALKITAGDRQDGNALWPRLHHRNVLRMLGAMSFTILDTPVTVYVMPYKEKSLADVIRAESFGQHSEDLERTRLWMRQVAKALEYLHSKGMCHLNVTVENVLFTSKFRALLCDFDSLRKVDGPINSSDVGLPRPFMPPEAKLSGYETDLWSYGLLVLDCLTKLSFSNEAIHVSSREENVQPCLRRLLHYQELFKQMEMAYPGCDIPEDTILQAYHFAHRFLQTDPVKRMTASLAKEHRFLGGDGRGLGLGVHDPVWTMPQEDDVVTTNSGMSDTQPGMEASSTFEPAEDRERIVSDNLEAAPDVPQVPRDALSDEERAQLVQYLHGIFTRAFEMLEKHPTMSQLTNGEQSSTSCSGNCETPHVTQESASDCKIDGEEADAQIPVYKDTTDDDNLHNTLEPDKEKSVRSLLEEVHSSEIADCVFESEEISPPPVVNFGQDHSGSAAFKEPSFFNLESLSLSSRFNSSKERAPQEKVRFKRVRRAFSRAGAFVRNFFK